MKVGRREGKKAEKEGRREKEEEEEEDGEGERQEMVGKGGNRLRSL